MNPVPGICPSCNNIQNSVFMQSIHSEFLFKMLSKNGDFKRNFLFCTPCIEWAKSEVFKIREPLRQQNILYSPISGVSRRTPDPFAVESHQQPMIESDDIDIVGKRLAGYTESPLHLSRREYFFNCFGMRPDECSDIVFFISDFSYATIFHTASTTSS